MGRPCATSASTGLVGQASAPIGARLASLKGPFGLPRAASGHAVDRSGPACWPLGTLAHWSGSTPKWQTRQPVGVLSRVSVELLDPPPSDVVSSKLTVAVFTPSRVGDVGAVDAVRERVVGLLRGGEALEADGARVLGAQPGVRLGVAAVGQVAEVGGGDPLGLTHVLDDAVDHVARRSRRRRAAAR